MAGISLYDYQMKAIEKMKTGCILCGGVGSGKSRTSLAYYYICNGGKLDSENYVPMIGTPKDLYIITTARKRDTLEWEEELGPFLLSTHDDVNYYDNKVVVDSWNNIKKYQEVEDAFFIFDEQRVVGNGTWVKSFLKIAKFNEWLLLSATPGGKTTYQSLLLMDSIKIDPSSFENMWYTNVSRSFHKWIATLTPEDLSDLEIEFWSTWTSTDQQSHITKTWWYRMT